MKPDIDHREEVRPGQSITETTIDGVPVFAFNVRPGDVQVWDQGNIGGNGKPNERAELAYAAAPDTQKYKSPYNVREGMIQVYDVDYWVKTGFPPHVSANHEWAVLTQFHPQPGNKGIPGFGGLTVHDGQFTYDDPQGRGTVFAQAPIKPESWFKPRMLVNWSAGLDGWVQILDRSTGLILGAYRGPTIAKGEWKSLKQGYYRAGGLPEGTVYQTQIEINSVTQVNITPTPVAYTPSPQDQEILKQALAALISIPSQIATAKSILSKIETDVKSILDRGPTPWPK